LVQPFVLAELVDVVYYCAFGLLDEVGVELVEGGVQGDLSLVENGSIEYTVLMKTWSVNCLLLRWSSLGP